MEIKVNKNIKDINLELIWITDGKGWLSAKLPLEETFDNNDYLLV